MFRIRDPQESLWQSQFLVTPKKAKRLERSWAEVFRNEALPLIDEERFAPMYCVENGRPNRAVQTVLGVHLLKEMFNLTDDEALEQLEFNTGRGFASAEIQGPDSLTRALTPSIMEMIGRSLIRVGELVLLISTEGGRLRLLPVETHNIEGGPDPSTWEYTVTLGGPSRTMTHEFVPSQSVLHFRYAAEASTPWRGNGPIAVANLAGKLSAETVNALANESSGPTGRLLGIPVDGQDATVKGLQADILNAKGRTALVETGDWNSAGSDNKVDLDSKRFGAEPPSGLVELVSVASQEVYSACGLNQALWGGSQAASVREAWRLALFGVLSPLGRLVEAELQDKLEDSVTLSWQELRASDLSGRARAFQSMVGGGMALADAVAVSGLMTPD